MQVGAGLAVFGFLARGTMARSNILVDTFTGWLPPRAADAVDGAWNLAWGLVAALVAERMARGALDTLASGTATMVLGLPTWWAVGVGAAAFALTALAALWWAARLLLGRGGGTTAPGTTPGAAAA